MKVAADADRLRREGIDVVDFGAGEPDFRRRRTSAGSHFANRRPNSPSTRRRGGTLELKQAICERHRTDYGTKLFARRMHGDGGRQARHLQT